jgi:hypothetical protein
MAVADEGRLDKAPLPRTVLAAAETLSGDRTLDVGWLAVDAIPTACADISVRRGRPDEAKGYVASFTPKPAGPVPAAHHDGIAAPQTYRPPDRSSSKAC